MSKPRLRTRLNDILGIEYPIVLAGMGGYAGPTLTAAVSNAGGLGVLGGTSLRPDELREWVAKTRKLTDKTFGIDIIFGAGLPQSGHYDDIKKTVPAEHQAYVEELKRELALPEPKSLRTWLPPLSEEGNRELSEVVLEERPDVFCCGLGTPDWLIGECRKKGIKVISLVGNVRQARHVAAQGVDIIVAQGYDAGGHTGRIGTFSLVPQVIQAVKPIPVLAAGGIADGGGLVAALAFGAVGVWVGTAFLATPECLADYIPDKYIDEDTMNIMKQKLLDATEGDAVVTRVLTGKSAHVLRNKLIERWEKDGIHTLPMAQQLSLVRPLETALAEGKAYDYISPFAGQISGMLNEIKPAEQVVKDIIEQAVTILEELPKNCLVQGAS